MESKLRNAGPTWLPGAQRLAGFSSLFFLLSLLFSLSAFGQADRTIGGRVVSETGQGLAGASISVKNTALGTRTDSAGNFTLQVPTVATLVVSYVGYAAQEIPIGRDQTDVQISLLPSGSATLSEVVV